MQYSVQDFNGVAVCGHISVPLKTKFSFLQSVPTGAGVTQSSMQGCGGGGAQSIPGVS
jgi:hypothetical protein